MAQYELNIQDYLRIVKRRRWVIVLTAAAVLGSVIAFTNMQTPIYQATATVKIEPSMSIPGVATDQSWDSYTAINTEVKIIKSTIVAERTAVKLRLLTAGMPDAARQSVVGSVQGKVNAERLGDTNLINISAVSSDPSETAKLANATAEVYIEKGIEDRNRRARELREFIEVQLKDAEFKLKKMEDNLRNYTERSGVKGIGGYLSTRLIELQNRQSELLKRYTNQHPEVQKLRQQIDSIENEMRKLPTSELEYARLSREVNINEELYTLLAKRYKEAQISEADRVQSAFIVTPATEPDSPIKPNRTMNVSVGVFLGIFLGFVLALVIENLDTSIGTIEDVERHLDLPVLGIIPHAEPSAQPTGAAGKAEGREQKIRMLRSKLIVYHSSKSPFVESYHTLRTNLKFGALNGNTAKGKIISITSAGIGEGKTLTAANFALAAAQSGLKTLLVEADLRRPSIHWLFGLQRSPGFSDCIIGTKKWQEVVRGTTDFLLGSLGTEKILQSPGIENLSVLTSGPSSPNPIDMLNAPEAVKLIHDLSAAFDLVILDCPPVLLFADALIMGSQAGGTIIVYQAGRMASRALKRAKDQLTNVKVPVIGVVLNNVRTSEIGSYYGYGYYYSYKYYSSEDSSKNRKA